MAKQAFDTLKNDLDDACAELRGFTLGHAGFSTQRSGVASIQRVTELCDRLVSLFKTGPDAARATALAASGRTRVLAAQYRLEVLRGKPSARPSKTN